MFRQLGEVLDQVRLTVTKKTINCTTANIHAIRPVGRNTIHKYVNIEAMILEI